MARKSREVLVGQEIVPPVSLKASSEREESKAERYVSIYVNDVQMQTTPWDIRLTLGELSVATRSQASGEPSAFLKVEVLADVRMSPQLAKTLVGILGKQLQDYENKFGEIPTSKG